MSVLKNVLIGAAGGLAGAFGMSAVMAIGKATGLVDKPIPHHLEEEIERRAGVEHKTSPAEKAALAQGGHHLMGAAFGALYGLLQPAARVPALLFGPLFGLAVYAFNEIGMGPALRLTPPPDQEHPITVGRRVFMHLVYGLMLALVSSQAQQRWRS